MLKKICAVAAISAAAVMGAAMPAAADGTSAASGGLSWYKGGLSWWMADSAAQLSVHVMDWVLPGGDED